LQVITSTDFSTFSVPSPALPWTRENTLNWLADQASSSRQAIEVSTGAWFIVRGAHPPISQSTQPPTKRSTVQAPQQLRCVQQPTIQPNINVNPPRQMPQTNINQPPTPQTTIHSPPHSTSHARSPPSFAVVAVAVTQG
jgi:hypothetical protein